MAYVRITEQLTVEVASTVRKMQATAQKMYQSGTVEIGTPIYAAMREAVLAAAWSLAPHLRDQLPEEWTVKPKTLYAIFHDANGRRVGAVTLSSAEGDPFAVPPQKTGFSYHREEHVEHQHIDDMVFQWFFEESEREAKRREITSQYDDVERQLLSFLKKHTSLNAALKEMPELEMYVPEVFMDKYRAPNPKRTNAKKETVDLEELSIDRDQLAAVAVAHRISTAAG